MVRYKIFALALVLTCGGVDGCPSTCKTDADCGQGELCQEGENDNGPGRWCFPSTPSEEQRQAGRRNGWRIKSVTINAGPVGVTATKEE